MLNSVVLMGRLTADPELKTTQSGVSVLSFCIAVDRSFQKQGEERQADFINLVAWRQSAEFISRYFRKGSMIAVQGSIQTRKYEDKEGNKRTAFEVVIDRASFCGSKAESGTASAPRLDSPSQGSSYSSASVDDFEEIQSDDDLPF